MIKRLATLACALGALAGTGGAATGHASPTNHFPVTFTIVCGGNELVLVSKPGSSEIVSVNGQDAHSVSVLFGLHVVDDQGNVVLDFHRGATGQQPTQTCTDTSWPDGWTATATTLITPIH